MAASNAGLAQLGAQDRQTVEAWLTEFDQNWDERRLGVQVRRLPGEGLLRQAALTELVKIDIRRQWQQGRRVKIDAYLKAFPELGTHETVAADLVAAEYEMRSQSGSPASLEDFLRRFPARAAELRTRLREASAGTATPAAAGVTQDTAGLAKSTRQLTERPMGRPVAPGSLPEQLGRYRIIKELGRGGMGSVHLAHDSQLDRQVALKVPHFGPDDKEVLERFHREARAAATIDHPNICPVYDVGEAGGIHYVTMAFIEGKSLAELLKGGNPLPQRSVAALVRKLALALQEAHQRGVIHRDLKPSNVMVNKRNEPVVMDFGLARRAQDARLTSQGMVMGTPAYMPPEQVEGDVASMGPGCDIYSLGAMMYEMLTGQTPFRGTVGTVFAQILSQEPPPPSSLRPDLDPMLQAVCLKALAKKPQDRFHSMSEFASALTRYLKKGDGGQAGSREESSAPLAIPVAQAAGPSTAEGEGLATQLLARLVDRLETAPANGGHGPRLWVTLLAACMILLAGGAILYIVTQKGTPEVRVDNTVVVRLTLPREANDPTVVVILVDGTPRTKEELAAPMKLSPGNHVLEIKRNDGTVITREFKVGQEDDQKLLPLEQENLPGPGNWVQLFNGKDLNGWSIFPSGTAGWAVRDGVMVGNGPDTVLFSKLGGYRNFHFRVEAQISDGGFSSQLFRAPFDSGLSAGYSAVINSTGDESNKTGSLVGGSFGSYVSILNTPIKPDTWFIQEVIADGNRITITVNGQKTVDYVDTRKAHMQGFLGLLKRGKDTTVKFRKVEVMELKPYRPVVRPGAEEGWTQLFNGNDLDGWKTPIDAGWELRDGVLVGTRPDGLLVSQRNDYRNFHFRVEAQVNDGGTGAQLFRANVARGPGSTPGYHAWLDSTSRESYRTGTLSGGPFGALSRVEHRLVKPDTWFTQEVIADGNHFRILVDGETVVDTIDEKSAYKEGQLALEKKGNDTVIKFRRIEVKELPAK